jgi:hypothetical protein
MNVIPQKGQCALSVCFPTLPGSLKGPGKNGSCAILSSTLTMVHSVVVDIGAERSTIGLL